MDKLIRMRERQIQAKISNFHIFLEDNILILQLSYRKLFPPIQDDPYAYGSVLEEACQRSLQMKKKGNTIRATTSDCRNRKRVLAAARNKET